MKQHLDVRLVLLLGLGVVIVVMTILQIFAPVLQQGLLARSSTYGVMQNVPARGSTPLLPATAPVSGSTASTIQGTLAQDTFQRPDQPFWGTASDGHIWEGDPVAQAPLFAVHGVRGEIGGGQGALSALLGPPSKSAEVTLSGSVSRFVATTVNMGAVLCWRNSNNWYKAYLDGKHLALLVRRKGTSTMLASVPFIARAGVSYTLRFRAVDGTLLAKAWRAPGKEPADWMLRADDTTLSSGRAGVRVLVQPQTVMHVQSFLLRRVDTISAP